MLTHRKVVVFGAVAVIVFDVLASFASRRFGFNYADASVGSFFIYVGIGFLAGRASPLVPIRRAASAAAIAGILDTSVGWALSSVIGAGQVPVGITFDLWLATAFFGTCLAALVGTIGGFGAKFTR